MWSARAGLGHGKWSAVSHAKGGAQNRSMMCTGCACPSLWIGEDKVGVQQDWVPAFMSAIGRRVAPHTFGTMLNFVADLQDQWATHFCFALGSGQS